MGYAEAPTLIATAGAPDANTYATVAQAEAYHAGHPYAEVWATASAVRMAQALLQATRLLDAQVTWRGTVATSTQALGWPRTGATDRQGRSLASTTIPTAIVQATAEYARHLLASDRTADRESDVQGLSRLKAGEVEITFRDGAGGVKALPDAVWLLLTGYGEVVRGGGQPRMTVPLARV